MNNIELPAKLFRPLCAALGYRRRTVRVWPAESVTLHGLNWSGGSKSVYSIVNLETMTVETAGRLGDPAPWNNPHEGTRIPVQPGYAIVKSGWFCGKPSQLYIYVHPDNMPRWLD